MIVKLIFIGLDSMGHRSLTGKDVNNNCAKNVVIQGIKLPWPYGKEDFDDFKNKFTHLL